MDCADMLRETGARQLLTANLGGLNIYWDGRDWRLAATMSAMGMVIPEKCAEEILSNLLKEGEI